MKTVFPYKMSVQSLEVGGLQQEVCMEEAPGQGRRKERGKGRERGERRAGKLRGAVPRQFQKPQEGLEKDRNLSMCERGHIGQGSYNCKRGWNDWECPRNRK